MNRMKHSDYVSPCVKTIIVENKSVMCTSGQTQDYNDFTFDGGFED